MNRLDSTDRIVVVIAGLAVVVMLAGCSGGEAELDCEGDVDCPEGQSCIDDVCLDEPVAGEECPDEREGETVEEMVCEEGKWVFDELPAAPTVQSVGAEPPTVDPGETIELTVDVVSPVEDELDYRWEVPGEWELIEDDEPVVELVSPEQWGRTATVEVVVTDPYDQSDSGEVAVSTHEVDGPEITSLDVEPETAMPGEQQTVVVEVDHPQGLDVEYNWSTPDNWLVEAEQGSMLELIAPEEHGMAESVEIVVTDTTGSEVTASETVSTVTNPGPSVEWTTDPAVAEPGGSMEVGVEADHELDYDIVGYDWSMDGDDWQLEVDVDDETTAQIEVPNQLDAAGVVEVVVTDEWDYQAEETLEVETGDFELIDTYEDLDMPRVADLSRDGSRVAYATANEETDPSFTVRDVDSGEVLWTAQGEGERFTSSVALSPEGEYLATSEHDFSDRGLYLYDVDEQEYLDDNTSTTWALRAAAISPDGQHVAWGRGNGTVRIRSVPDLDEVDSFSGGGWRSYDIKYGQDHLIHTSDNGVYVHSYEGDDYDQVAHFSEGLDRLGVAIPDDDSFVAYQTGGGEIRVREVGGDWEELATLSVDVEFHSLAASGDGRLLAAEDIEEEEIVFYETDEWTEFGRLDDCGQCRPSYDASDDDDISSAQTKMSFRADGERFVVPSAEDDTVYLYEWTDGS